MNALASPTVGLTSREYQKRIAESASQNNTLVVLPTGLGKTIIALLVASQRLSTIPNSKIIVLAPTKPLVLQHSKFFREHIGKTFTASVLTGEVSPIERVKLFTDSTLIFATPEVIRNDLREERYTLRDASLVVFDEAHRCVRDYAYSEVAEAYKQQASNPLILGLTASPSAKKARIDEICQKLGIKNVETRTEADEDVSPYVKDVSLNWERLKLPVRYGEVSQLLRKAFDERVQKLRNMRQLPSNVPASKKVLLALSESLREKLKRGGARFLYGAVILQAQAMSLTHAVELLETQGVRSMERFLSRLETAETKSARNLAKDPRVLEAQALASKLDENEHPKNTRLRELVENELATNSGAKLIVFTQFRDSVDTIVKRMNGVPGVRPVRFVGQATRREDDVGLSQAEQLEILDGFRGGTFNVLVTTSIGEEGLHVPDVDHVIFYEAVPSEIRLIQRRGRTGRTRAGKVTILMTEGTIDEAYYWSSRRKEQQMRKTLETLKKKGVSPAKRKETLLDYA